jgi:hypothetical protein
VSCAACSAQAAAAGCAGIHTTAHKRMGSKASNSKRVIRRINKKIVEAVLSASRAMTL